MPISPEDINPDDEGLELNDSLPYYRELIQEGYQPVNLLRNSERYVAYEVIKGDTSYFFKGVRAVASRKLKTELWFSEQLNTKSTDDAIAIAPRIIESRPSWYVAEFLSGSPLCPEATCYEADLSNYVPAMVSILDQLDKLKLPAKAQVRDKLDGPSANKAAARAVKGGVISDSVSRKALNFVGKSLKTSEKRIQHGDFTPWHIYDLGDGHFSLIDSEHAGTLPRFTDLAFIYERLFNRCGNPQLAASLLSLFIEKHIEDKVRFAESFLPILADRAVIGTYYSTIDWVNHGYKISSKDLVERCIANDLSALTS